MEAFEVFSITYEKISIRILNPRAKKIAKGGLERKFHTNKRKNDKVAKI